MVLRSATPVAFLYVADRERSIRFYCDTLGMTLKSSDAFGDFIDTGRGLIRMTVMPDHQGSSHPAFGWHVDDIRAIAQSLRARGVTFTLYDGMGQDDLGVWTSPDNATSVAWFADPDGNVLSISSG
jgi:catechol 2,3-dioxygenase-like lactoylglutathione lyase family enzyme